MTGPPTWQDGRRVGAAALASILLLVALGVLLAFVPPSRAPRVNVRWADGVGETARQDIAGQLKLIAGEHLEGRTWAYDLADPSPRGVEAVITHPSVEDTHHIERSRRLVSADAPEGFTRIRGGLSRLRDAARTPWLVRFAWCLLIVSVVWLATTGRLARASRGGSS